jgi:hypothetical protein
MRAFFKRIARVAQIPLYFIVLSLIIFQANNCSVFYNFFTVCQKLYETNLVHPYSSHMLSNITKSMAKEAPWFGRSQHNKQNKTKQTNFIDRCPIV